MTATLCINVGSSSLKAATFDGTREVERVNLARHGDEKTDFADLLTALSLRAPDLVAHRLVHGGPAHDSPVVIDDKLVADLEGLVELAPLHMPPALAVLHEARKALPNAVHIACFDTAFHHTMPAVARRYALPASLTGDVVLRYGFHGLSCENAVNVIGAQRARRAVIAHLGSGCSVTAIRDGASADTSMGFTPSGGVIMATRAGDLDPGVILYLLSHGHSSESLERAVNFESGLVAVGGTSDVQQLLERSGGDADARTAVDMFCYRVAQQIAAYAVTLGGFDTLVFTGGIGEHSTEIRGRITAMLEMFQPFEIAVVSANEERIMARHALRISRLDHD